MIIRWPSARSVSCATTTSTSVSTRPTSSSLRVTSLQEFDPVRINPRGDTKIIHVHRFPAEVDVHYDVAVGLHADIRRGAWTRWPPRWTTRCRYSPGHERIRGLLAEELDRAAPMTASR